MDKNTALSIWGAVFGSDQSYATDCFGTYMYKDDYGDYETKRVRPGGDGKKHQYGWDIDHIRPKVDYTNENDADFLNNYEPMHRENNVEKADNYPHFVINSVDKYNVINCTICSSHGLKGYGIVSVATGKRVDWKGVQNQYFTE